MTIVLHHLHPGQAEKPLSFCSGEITGSTWQQSPQQRDDLVHSMKRQLLQQQAQATQLVNISCSLLVPIVAHHHTGPHWKRHLAL